MAVAGEIVIELKIDAGGMPVVVRRAGTVLREFQSTLNQTAKSVKRLEYNSDSLSTKFRHLVMTLGNLRFVAMDINDLFLRLPVSILKTAGELERMQVLMTGLSKETSKAAKEAEGLKNFNFVTALSKKAPFDIAALSDSFVKLKTAGIDPADGSMNALVNSVARFGGTSESLKRASVAIQQMSGKGVISMEELRQQLGEAVPTAMQDMADGMGVSMAELAKIVQTGTLKTGPAIGKMLNMMQVNNAGAAAEMMKTWTGTLSRLKSEWELAAKFIVDSGFGDGAKDAALKLTAALRTDDFKRFSSDAGAGLGEAMNSLISITQTLIKYREEIALAAQAWVAYKVVFGLIGPMGNALEASSRRGIKSMQDEVNAIMRRSEAQRAGAQAGAVDAAARQAQATKQLASYTADLTALRARNAAIVAETARLNAIQSFRPKDFSNLASDLAAKAAATKALAVLKVETDANAAAQTRLATKVAVANLALERQQVDAARAAGSLTLLTSASRLSSTAALAAGVAARAFSGVVGLLGGPIGIAILAIMGLVYWWNQAGQAAEDSADRQRRAAARLSNEKDLADFKDDARAAKGGVADAEAGTRQKVDIGMGIFREQNAQEKQASNAALATAKAKLSEAEGLVARVEGIVGDAKSRVRTDGINADVNAVIEARSDATNLEIAKIGESNRAVLDAVKGDAKKFTAETKRVNDLKQDAEVRGYAARIAGREAAAAKLKELALKMPEGSLDAKSNLRAAKVEQDAADQLRIEQQAFIERRNAKDEFKPKKEKKEGAGAKEPVVNKIDAFIGNLREKQAELKALIPGLLGDLGKSDEVAAALAELEQKFKSKDFDYRVGKKTVGPTDAQKQTMRDLTEQNVQLATLKDDAKKLAGEINKMAPDYEHALKLLADPLGTGEMKQTNKFDEMIAKLKAAPSEFKKFAEGAGIAADSFAALLAKMEEGRTQAATIDMGKGYADMVGDNQKLSLDLIEDDRERARQQAAIAETLAAKQASLAIEEFTKAKVATDLIDQYRAQVEIGAALRAKDLAMKSRTPIEKLADDWQNSMTKMEEAGAQWSGGFVDMMVSSAKTGKLEFGSFVESVLADILKIQLQRSLGDPLREVVNAGTGWLKGQMPDLGNNGRNGVGSALAETAATEAAREVKRFSMAALQAKDGLGEFVNTGVDAATQGLVSSVAAQGQELIATGSFTSSIGTATSAVYAFINALQAQSGGSGGTGILGSVAGLFGGGSAPSGFSTGAGTMAELASLGVFADGGIMSSMGPVSLRKYAAGGIANSPQLALYGEAGPEAYVPLPDGRSIPVSLSGSLSAPGAGMPSVTVNVINQSGQQVGAQTSQPRFDGKQMVLDIVLTAANSPGPFRDGLKGAVGR